MSVSFGTVQIGSDVSFGKLALAQMSVGPVVVWEAGPPANSMTLTLVNAGTAVELPLEQYLTTNYQVDWGDGTAKTTNVNTHTYANGAGTYKVYVTGSAKWKSSASITMPACLKTGLTKVEVTGTCPIRAWNYRSFQNCAALTSVPGTLFNGVVAVTDSYAAHTNTQWNLGSFFSNCSKLSSVGEALFSGTANKPASVRGISFDRTFSGCTVLKSVGAKLFNALPKITWTDEYEGYLSFNGVFANSGLTGIPTGLFGALPPSVQEYNFNTAFSGCKGLTAIPTGLFSALPTLAGSYINIVPIQLSQVFYNCTGLKGVPSDILTKVPNTAKVNIGYMFSGCTGINTAVPKVWTTHASTKDHAYFYQNCTKATNYANIPAGWK